MRLPPLDPWLMCLASHILQDQDLSRAMRPRAPRSFWRAGTFKMLQRVSNTRQGVASVEDSTAPNLKIEVDGVEAILPDRVPVSLTQVLGQLFPSCLPWSCRRSPMAPSAPRAPPWQGAQTCLWWRGQASAPWGTVLPLVLHPLWS